MTTIWIKALRQLGFRQVSLYAWYRFLLQIGFYSRLRPPAASPTTESLAASGLGGSWFTSPTNTQLQVLLGLRAASLLAEADQIAAGQIRLFGANPRRLQLEIPGLLRHWTYYEKHAFVPSGERDRDQEAGNFSDVKFLWEPARFGWACTLGRAYRLTGDESYAGAFWQHTETFLAANPAYIGPNWSSAQEAALRLMVLVWAYQVFAPSPQTTPVRCGCLAQAVAESAARIPPTLIYARAQNNNHLLSEAAGLYTASLFLPDHPMAKRWRKLGWHWFNQGVQQQFDADGAYIQHSVNYHRLALQLALWVSYLAEIHHQPLPGLTRQRLAAATRWLLALSDPHTGCLPNLGPNDGSYIFPLADGPFDDFRPVLQAAASAFLDEHPFPNGTWDEMQMWLAVSRNIEQPRSGAPAANPAQTPHTLHHPQLDSWAYLRIANFHSRPGHADQLHLDMWWRGMNVAQDAGTFLYNAPHPWDNALTHAAVHNTLTVSGLDQMIRAGRFLYLDWAQAQVVSGNPAGDGSWLHLVGQHDGYRRQGVIHQRSVTTQHGGWVIEDTILPDKPAPKTDLKLMIRPEVLFRLHWLLPDWPWELDGARLALTGPAGQVVLQVIANNWLEGPVNVTIARAGELITGLGPIEPTWGWISHTYGTKLPALSAAFNLETQLASQTPLTVTTTWTFLERSDAQTA